MKLKLPLLLLALVGIIFLWNTYQNKTIKSTPHQAVKIEKDGEEDGGEKEDGILEAQKREFELTRDVSLGYIPQNRLISAYENLLVQRRQPGYSKRTASALAWTERGSNSDAVGPSNGNTRAGNGVTSGRIRAIWVDLADPTNHTVWVGGIDGGIWKTNDISSPTATWTPINDFFSNLAVGSICQDPTNTNIMYFGTGEKTANGDAVRGGGIWKSTDHGITWNLLPSTTNFWNVSKILCDNSGNVYVSTMGMNGTGIQRSSNGGNNWTNITPLGLNTAVTEMKLSNTGRMHIVCGYSDGYFSLNPSGYRFTDNPVSVTPATWISPTTSFPTQYNVELAVTGNSLYALAANASYQTPIIYKSTDGGANWAATVTSPPANSATNDLSSGQGWYNLAIAVDPANDQNVLVGGLNCYRSINGGVTWQQISTWVGSGLSYVHADQQTAVWNDNQVLVGSDGGIHYSFDAGATFKDRNTGLRLKQFYSVAIHPTLPNYFLAGAQDNGVHQFNSPGLGASVEVTGGDGAFVQIDQDEPQYQFGSYTYNTYRRSTNSGATWTPINYSNKGQFINPTDYDNINNKMYAGGGYNEYVRWNNPQTGSSFSDISVPMFNGSVTHVSVSPYTSNRVFFGTSGSRIVRVDNAQAEIPSATNITGTGMTGVVSCVAIGTNDNNLIATYTNYGSVHVWASTTGGGASGWTNISGNLPDIPVRWALFYPEDNTKAIIATEMGIYETSNINGAATVWTQNPNFPIVRTDMLRYRKSDGTIAAATHGRGLWTAVIPKTIPYVRFASPFINLNEASSGIASCRRYKDYSVNMNIDLPPTGDANITLALASGGTAIEGVDFDFTTNGNFAAPSKTLKFADGSASPQPVTIRIYDDAEIKNNVSFALNYTIGSGTNALAAPSSLSLLVNINDNDIAPTPAIEGLPIYTIGSAAYIFENPFNAKLKSMRSQMLYKASELIAAGINPGSITNLSFNIQKHSLRAYQNLNINMGTTKTINYLANGGVNVISTTTVKSLASYNTVNGWNNFTLDAPFVWDGISNIAIEICYDNITSDAGDFADEIIGYSDGGSVSQGNLFWQNNINCGSPYTTVSYYTEGIKPQLQLKVTPSGNPIANSGTRSEYIATNGTYYFYSGANVLNKLSAVSAPLGCVSSSIFEQGNIWQFFTSGFRSQKVFEILPETNAGASYTVGLYYTLAELGGKDPASLVIAKTSANTMAEANFSNTQARSTTFTPYGNGYLFTASFTGFSKFFLIENGALPVNLISLEGTLRSNTILLNWSTESEQNLKLFEVQKSADGSNFHAIGTVNGAGNSTSLRNYNFNDNEVSELNYYRLKMIDRDGKSVLSNTVLVKAPNIAQKLMIVNNPFRDNLTIRLSKVPKSTVRVEMISISGSKVFSKQYGITTDINIQPGNISAGTYLLKTTIDGKEYVNKVVKQ